jgi:hypothetical protein
VGSAFGDRIHIAIATIPSNTTTPTAAAIVQLGFFGAAAGTGAAAVMAFGAVGVGRGCDSAPEAPGALVDPPIGSARGGVVAMSSGGTDPDVSTSIGNPARPRRKASRN